MRTDISLRLRLRHVAFVKRAQLPLILTLCHNRRVDDRMGRSLVDEKWSDHAVECGGGDELLVFVVEDSQIL